MNSTYLRRWPRKPIRGFSLVEVTLALGIASFCLLGVAGMLPVGLSSKRSSTASLLASGVVNTVFSDLRSTSGNASGSPIFQLDPNSGEVQTRFLAKDGEDIGTAWNPEAVYRLSVQLTPPAADERLATKARIIVSWPAAADQNPGQWPKKYSGAFETVSAIDRN